MLYKIKHKPTGLFYQPKKGRFSGDISSVAILGKVYHKKPKLSQIGSCLVVSNAILKHYPGLKQVSRMTGYRDDQPAFDVIKEDWCIIEAQVSGWKEL
jgi:hypothetical protein